ncbi:MAG: hypothetical protein JSW73_02330 [Candidatus Woesearchaeota archaeon]|nr:MAG: hypothetical protein JSW73_02330 [Candidatus Woesearchaeota archaeon]
MGNIPSLFKVSLHTHTIRGFYKGTTISKYTIPSLDEYIHLLYKNDISIAAITDHSYDGGFDDLVKKVSHEKKYHGKIRYYDDQGINLTDLEDSKKDLHILRGVEITRPFHILAIGYKGSLNITPKSMPESMEELTDLLSEVDKKEGIRIVAHPFGISGANRDQLNYLVYNKLIEAIEVFNPQNVFPIFHKKNNDSLNYSIEKNIAGVASPDNHTIRDFSKAYIKIPENLLDFSNINLLVKSLKENIINRKFDRHEGRVNLLSTLVFYQAPPYLAYRKGREQMKETIRKIPNLIKPKTF